MQFSTLFVISTLLAGALAAPTGPPTGDHFDVLTASAAAAAGRTDCSPAFPVEGAEGEFVLCFGKNHDSKKLEKRKKCLKYWINGYGPYFGKCK